MKFITTTLFILLAVTASVTNAQDRWYKYEVNKPYEYIGELKENIQQAAGGQTMNVTSEVNMAYTITVLEYLEDGSMNAKIDIKSAVSFTESPSGLQTHGEDLANTTFTFTIDSDGHITELDSTVNDKKPQSVGLVAQMVDFLPQLPSDKLEDGESWTRTTNDTSGTAEKPVIISRESEYEVDGTAEVNGVNTMNIKYEGELSIDGETSFRGQDIVILGEGTYTGHVYLAKELGVVQKIETESKSEEVYTSPNNPSNQSTLTRNRTSKIELVSQ